MALLSKPATTEKRQHKPPERTLGPDENPRASANESKGAEGLGYNKRLDVDLCTKRGKLNLCGNTQNPVVWRSDKRHSDLKHALAAL